MSKKIAVVLSIGCIFLLTGCGKSEKTLTCVQTFEDLSPTTKWEYELQFDKKEKKLVSYIYREIRNYKEDISTEELEKEYKSISGVCDNYADMKGVECNSSKDDKKVTTTLEVTMKDLDESGNKILGLKQDQDSTYDDFKKTLESSGFSCK